MVVVADEMSGFCLSTASSLCFPNSLVLLVNEVRYDVPVGFIHQIEYLLENSKAERSFSDK